MTQTLIAKNTNGDLIELRLPDNVILSSVEVTHFGMECVIDPTITPDSDRMEYSVSKPQKIEMTMQVNFINTKRLKQISKKHNRNLAFQQLQNQLYSH